MRVILRFPDLAKYGVKNWVTLGMWIDEREAPAGFYLGSNTRAWFQDEWDDWLANRAQAGTRREGRPPDIAKPGPSASTEGTGRIEINKPPRHSEPAAACQAPLLNGRAGV